MADQRKRISLEERKHYCQLIENGSNYHAINEMYQQKHELRLADRTFRLLRKNAKKILSTDEKKNLKQSISMKKIFLPMKMFSLLKSNKQKMKME